MHEFVDKEIALTRLRKSQKKRDPKFNAELRKKIELKKKYS